MLSAYAVNIKNFIKEFCMKNYKLKAMRNLAGIIAIVAVIEFAFTTCGGGAGGGLLSGGSVNTKFRFSGTEAPPQSLPINPNVRSAIMRSITTSNDFAPYTAFYNTTLGGNSKLVRKITPTSFKVHISILTLFGVIEGDSVVNQSQLMSNTTVDFAQNVTVTPGEINLGTYDTITLFFNGPVWLSEGLTGVSSVQFPWPQNETNFEANTQMRDAGDIMYNEGAEYNNGTVTVGIGRLFPNGVRHFLSSEGKDANRWAGVATYTDSPSPMQQLMYFAFGGNTRKLLHTPDGTSLSLNDVNGGYDTQPILSFQIPTSFDAYVIPFTPITIPENATAVRYEIYWNLTDLIEQYQGADNTADTADDIFILKNGWWEALNIRAIIEEGEFEHE
jgi:hypothetical protein